MSSVAKRSDTFESRVRAAMLCRGISSVPELAACLSKRLGRNIDPAALARGLTMSGGAMRADIVHAMADELCFSTSWLSLGAGFPQRWVPLNDRTKEIAEVFSSLSEAAQAELAAYGYRLLRINKLSRQTLVIPYPEPPRPEDFI